MHLPTCQGLPNKQAWVYLFQQADFLFGTYDRQVTSRHTAKLPLAQLKVV